MADDLVGEERILSTLHPNLAKIQSLTSKLQAATATDERARLLIVRAHQHQANGDEPQSVSDYLDALAVATQPDDICHSKAMISLAMTKADDKERATWWALGAIDADPQDPDGHFALGHACEASGYNHLAVAAFQQVLRVDPQHPWVRRDLTRCLRQIGETAGILLQQAFKSHPLAETRLTENQPRKERPLECELAVDGDRIFLLTNSIETATDPGERLRGFIARAQQYRANGDATEATADCQRALELATRPADVSHIKVLISLLRSAAYLHDDSDAKDQAAWWAMGAIEADPMNADGHYAIGYICSLSDYLRCAIDAQREALRLDPQHRLARLELARSLQQAGDVENSRRELQHYIALYPHDARGHLELGRTFQAYPHDPALDATALSHYETALKLCSDGNLRTLIETHIQVVIKRQ